MLAAPVAVVTVLHCLVELLVVMVHPATDLPLIPSGRVTATWSTVSLLCPAGVTFPGWGSARRSTW
ncbi:hypothetical protein NKG94_11045 [Micromonospora sp. M12]